MIKKYKITYRAVKNHRSVVMEAFSKYDAKQRFFRTYPGKEIVSIEVVEQGETARGRKKTVDNRFSPSVTDQKGDIKNESKVT